MILDRLYALQDTKYRDFQGKLLPTVDPGTIIGVRTPDLRRLAKELAKEDDIGTFLDTLPHTWFDENQFHAFILSELKDYSRCIALVDRFLPYIDNWATSDQLSPKVFRKHKTELLSYIKNWLKSDRTYTVRFAVGMLMQHFLDNDFSPAYPKLVAAIKSDEYYINMMRAWYFATALAKQYDAIIPYIEQKKLDPWTHSKAIQKAVESYRIKAEQKEYLKTFRLQK
ncbi:MAG: DNA alkylation repair protein [Spirochaetia bacterium]|nr:DNA alkylation repair protein [Spirochaetia bacterium]